MHIPDSGNSKVGWLGPWLPVADCCRRRLNTVSGALERPCDVRVMSHGEQHTPRPLLTLDEVPDLPQNTEVPGRTTPDRRRQTPYYADPELRGFMTLPERLADLPDNKRDLYGRRLLHRPVPTIQSSPTVFASQSQNSQNG